MKKIIKDLDIKISGLLMLIILIITFANVISRYFIHASFSFTEELTTVLYVLIVLLGASYAVKEGSHFALDLLVNALSPRWQRVCYFISDLIGFILCAIISYVSVPMIIQQYKAGTITISMHVYQWIFSLGVPIGMFSMLYRYVRRLINSTKALIKGDAAP